MAEKSINSLVGLLSTKKLPDSGILKTGNNRLQGNHENNSFRAKLTNSMKSDARLADQPYTPVPSELNNITDNDDINHLLEQLSMGLQANQTANTDDNHLPLNPEQPVTSSPEKPGNTNITKELAKDTITEQPVTSLIDKLSTNLFNMKINEQKSVDIQDKPDLTKLVTNDTGKEQPVTSSPEKPGNTNITKELSKDTITEQPPTSLIDRLSTNQYNTKINEQKSVDIQDKTDLTKLVTNDTGKESFSQSLKLPGSPILDSHKESGKSALNVRLNSNEDSGLIHTTASAGNISSTKQNTVNDSGSNNSLPSIEKAITNTELNSYKITNNKAVNTNTLFNSEENANDNIPDFIKAQLAEKTSLAKAGINQTHQQGSTKINADNNESPNIVNSPINSREANVAKSFENTSIANNNGTNIVEATGPVNTSSDNSFFNNQDADTSYELQANPVNIKHNTEPLKNFTNTLTQISDSSKPLGSLGNNVADNIIQNAKLYTQGGKSEIKVQLSPPELGTLKLEFSFEDDILETKITVERSAVKDVIEKDIPKLRELISNSNIDVGKLDVSLQENESGKQDFMNKDFHSDSKSKSTQDFSNQENEYYEDNADGETVANNTESTQINYLV